MYTRTVITCLRTRLSLEIRASLLCLRGSRTPFRHYQTDDVRLENMFSGLGYFEYLSPYPGVLVYPGVFLSCKSTHPTTVVRNYWHNYEKRYCFGSHKELKTLFRDRMVKLKIISLYIYKDLRLKT